MARLIVVHGTGSHIAQGIRVDTYRLLSASYPNTHIIALDYRGWGYSSGTPSEEGVIIDGETVLKWVIEKGNVHHCRILLVSQSLGTAIAMGVATRFHENNPDKQLAGVVLINAFISLPRLLLDYKMGGFLPLFAPFKLCPKAGDYYFRKFLRATFDSAKRMRLLVSMTKGTKFTITLVCAMDDRSIPYEQSWLLFGIARGEGDITEMVPSEEVTREFDGGRIKYIQTLFGGHNNVQKSDTVIKAVVSAWEFTSYHRR